MGTIKCNFSLSYNPERIQRAFTVDTNLHIGVMVDVSDLNTRV